MKISDIVDDPWYQIPEGWDWLRMLPGWTYIKLIVNNRKFDYSISVSCNRNNTSRDLAIKIDNICKGLFHYRDIVPEGESLFSNPEHYIGVFSFELADDLIAFKKLLQEREK